MLNQNPDCAAKALKCCIIFLFVFNFQVSLRAQPTVTSFAPKSGVVGAIITINGNQFSPIAAENIVYFGRVRATVLAATTISLKVTVPLRATDRSISVTSKGLTAFSAQPFTLVSGGALTATSYPTRWGFGVSGNLPSGLLVDDWNDDGKPDLLSANFNTGNISLFQSDAYPLVMQMKSEVKFAAGTRPEGLATGDLDGDGKPDLVVTSIDNHLFSVFRNSSAAGGIIAFDPRADFPAGAFNNAPRGVALRDLDGDGKPDLVLAGNNKWISGSGSYGTLSIQRNTSRNGTLSFVEEKSLETGEYPRKVVIADFDGDGKPDLATNNHVSGSVTIYRNTSTPGAISFTARTDYSFGHFTEQLAAGDLNGDGKPELAVTSSVASVVSVLKNTSASGAISFGERRDLGVTSPIGLAIGDLSGDGKPELAVASYSTHKISVFPNNSMGGAISFAPKIDYQSYYNPIEVSIGDVDGDGHPDLALTNGTANLISVMKMEPGRPTLSLGEDQRLCQGDSTALTANLPNASFLWSTGATTNSIKVRQSGSYWVKATTGGVTLSDTVNIQFNPPPAFQLGRDTTLCEGDKLLLQPGVAGATYTWQDGSTSSTQLASQSGTYWLHLEKDGCATADTIKINFQPAPRIQWSNDTAFCTGSTLLLSAANPLVEHYTWFDGTHQPEIRLTMGGTVWVQVRGSNGCSSSDTMQVIETAGFTLGKDTTLCEGSTLSYLFSLSAAKYLWNDGSTGSGLTVRGPGLYWLEATEGGCTHRDTIRVAYQTPPLVNLGPDTSLCEGVGKVLDAYTPNATYLWNNGSAASNYTVQKTGTYGVSVSLNGCIMRDTVHVLYTPLPRVDLGKDTLLCSGHILVLQPRVNNVSYLWQDGSTAASLTVRTPGQYQLVVANTCGVASDTIVVTEGPCTLVMPNAFTPNRDGKNDLFGVKYPAFIKTFRMEIYDRWGERVFMTKDPYKSWDGTIRNSPAPTGSYIWTISVIDKTNKEQFFRGTVVLIR